MNIVEAMTAVGSAIWIVIALIVGIVLAAMYGYSQYTSVLNGH